MHGQLIVSLKDMSAPEFNLGLHGNIERGRRLIGDEQARTGRPAPWRSSRAAACPSRELMWIVVKSFRRRADAHLGETGDRLLACRFARKPL